MTPPRDARVDGLQGIPLVRSSAPGRPASVRQANLALIASLVLASSQETSRAEIAGRTGLTGPTVSRLVRELLALGIVVEEAAERDGSMGRPSTPLLPATGTIVGIGLEINVDYIAGCAIDLSGSLVGQFTVAIEGSQSDPAEVLRLLRSETETLIADLHRRGVQEVCGVCLAVPGVVDREARSIVYASNLGWRHVTPGDVLGDLLDGDDSFSIENDANLQAIAATGALRDSDGEPPSFLYVFGAIGIGGAIVRDGQLELGTRGWAGEIGHTTVDPNGPPCHCGSTGCLETYIGRRNLLRASGLSPDASTQDIVRALDAGRPDVVTAVGQAGVALGIALSTALNLLDLRDVVLGTDIGPLLPWLAPRIDGELDRRLLGRTAADIDVHPMPISRFPSSIGGALKCLQTRLEPSSIARAGG